MEMCAVQDSAYSHEGQDIVQLMQNRICDYLTENAVLGRIAIIIFTYDEYHAARQHILDMNSRIYVYIMLQPYHARQIYPTMPILDMLDADKHARQSNQRQAANACCDS